MNRSNCINEALLLEYITIPGLTTACEEQQYRCLFYSAEEKNDFPKIISYERLWQSTGRTFTSLIFSY